MSCCGGNCAGCPGGGCAGCGEPVCREFPGLDEALVPLAVQALEKRGLIRIDYDIPLSGFDYAGYDGCFRRGSLALTARGQAVIESLAVQGISE